MASPPLMVSAELRHEAMMLVLRSGICLAIGLGLILLASRRPPGRERTGMGLGLIALVFVSAFAVRLNPVPFIVFMGDYDQYDESGEQLTRYFTGSSIRFDAHLTSLVMRAIVSSGLAAADDPKRAFVVLSVLATIAWFAALAVLLAQGRGSSWAFRYVGLLVATPVTVLFFGYREIAYLPFVPLALGWPLVFWGMRTASRRHVAGGAFAVGLAVGLHGYSAIGLASLFVFVVVTAPFLRAAVARGADAVAFGTLGWVGAIPLEIIFLRLTVEPHHAGDIPWRPLLHRRWDPDSHRYAEAILSAVGLRDAVASLVLVGALLLVVAMLALWETRKREAIAVAAATAPAVVWLVANWTVQGIGVDTDSIVGLFPVLPLLATAAALTARSALAGLGVLAAGHAALWLVILHHSFHAFQID